MPLYMFSVFPFLYSYNFLLLHTSFWQTQIFILHSVLASSFFTFSGSSTFHCCCFRQTAANMHLSTACRYLTCQGKKKKVPVMAGRWVIFVVLFCFGFSFTFFWGVNVHATNLFGAPTENLLFLKHDLEKENQIKQRDTAQESKEITHG